MYKEAIQTEFAPQAIGTYSQAIKVGHMVFVSGQIPVDPFTEKMVDGEFKNHVAQVFENLSAVIQAAGGRLQDIVKLTVYLTDLNHFDEVNQVMSEFFNEPFPSRAAVEVSRLPKDALVEMDAIVILKSHEGLKYKRVRRSRISVHEAIET